MMSHTVDRAKSKRKAATVDRAKPKRCTASEPCTACTNSVVTPPAAEAKQGQLVTEVDGLKLHLSSANRTGYHGVQYSPMTSTTRPYTVEFRSSHCKPVKIGQCATALEGAVLYARHALHHAPYVQQWRSDEGLWHSAKSKTGYLGVSYHTGATPSTPYVSRHELEPRTRR